MSKQHEPTRQAAPAESGDRQEVERPPTPSAPGPRDASSRLGWPSPGEGAVIFLLTAYAYVVTYRYEAGYLSAYRIPSDFVDVSVSSIISTCLSILFLIGTGIAYGHCFSGLKRIVPRRVSWIRLPVFVVLPLGLLWLIGVRGPLFAYSGPALLIITVAALWGDLLPLEDQALATALTQGPTHRGALVAKVTIVMVLIMSAVWAPRVGASAARAEVGSRLCIGLAPPGEHPTTAPAKLPVWLLVRARGERWLCAEIDPESGEVLPHIRVVEPTSLSSPAQPLSIPRVHFPDTSASPAKAAPGAGR